jgi:hypothetical protein
MAKKIRLTQEEEIVKMLKKEGFEELSEKDIKKEPYKSIYRQPGCFKGNKENRPL